MRSNSQILRRLCSGDAGGLRSYGTQHLPAVLVSATTRRLSRKCAAKGIDFTSITNYQEQNDPFESFT